MTVPCTSRIVAVTVHARGAVVTRAVDLPKELPAEACALTIPALPAVTPAGSLRAEAEGGRDVVGLRSRLVLPEQPPEPEGRQARLRELDLRDHQLRLEQAHLGERRGDLLGLEPRLRGLRRDGVDPAARAKDALAANALVTDLLSGLDARLRELADGLRELGREREALALEAAQRGATPVATRAVTVRLGPAEAGVLEALRIRYVVPSARWWPAYAARLSEGGTQAEWSLEAFVAQTSGEDWDDVALSLSTADLIQDARLPELPSLRLGRSQPARPSGFRAPPEGLDALFQGYDRDQRRLGPPAPPPPPVTGRVAKPKPQLRPAPAPEPAPMAMADEDDFDGEAELATMAPFADIDARVVTKSAKRSISFAAPAPAQAPGGARGGGGGGGARDEPAPTADPSAIEPADAWLDFDGLMLGASEDRTRRGRLDRVPEDAAATARAKAEAALAAVTIPSGAVDPVSGRGHFDHQYTAAGRVDVASRGEAQRVPLTRSAAACRPRVRIAPEVEQVAYREVELTNPTDGPLLSGPVDVFLSGSLLTTSAIPKVGRGGPLQLGLGAEDRIRVARNARIEESTAGLIGKTTAVEHTVTIELTSALPHAVQVDVVDRIPVTDDDDVTVEFVRAEPEGEPYDQRDRDAPVRGGRRWQLELPGKGEARIEFVYRVSFPSKRELVGGNRRD